MTRALYDAEAFRDSVREQPAAASQPDGASATDPGEPVEQAPALTGEETGQNPPVPTSGPDPATTSSPVPDLNGGLGMEANQGSFRWTNCDSTGRCVGVEETADIVAESGGKASDPCEPRVCEFIQGVAEQTRGLPAAAAFFATPVAVLGAGAAVLSAPRCLSSDPSSQTCFV